VTEKIAREKFEVEITIIIKARRGGIKVLNYHRSATSSILKKLVQPSVYQLPTNWLI